MAHDAAELFGIHTEAAGGGAPIFLEVSNGAPPCQRECPPYSLFPSRMREKK